MEREVRGGRLVIEEDVYIFILFLTNVVSFNTYLSPRLIKSQLKF